MDLLGPIQCQEVLYAVAACELAAARGLARKLPLQSQFEAKTDIALAIGACGERMQSIVTSLDAADEWALVLPGHEKDKAPRKTIRSIYSTAIQLFASAELRRFNFLQPLERNKIALSTLPGISVSLAGSSPTTKQFLLEFDRIFHDPIKKNQKPVLKKILIPVRRGPEYNKHDKRWKFAAPGEKLPRMKRLEAREGLLHKLHHTAFRETLAAEVAALNLLEYDGMPWQFYIDMARQVGDEGRHAKMAAESLYANGGKFGQVLLPRFGNYYQLFYDMSLPERLIALNLDTEGPGCSYLRSVEKRMRQMGNIAIANLFEYIEYDERNHARFGVNWLRYLFPDAEQRKAVIERSHAMLAINLASIYAEDVGDATITVIDHWMVNATGPLLYQQPAGPDYEIEMSIAPKIGKRGF